MNGCPEEANADDGDGNSLTVSPECADVEGLTFQLACSYDVQATGDLKCVWCCRRC